MFEIVLNRSGYKGIGTYKVKAYTKAALPQYGRGGESFLRAVKIVRRWYTKDTYVQNYEDYRNKSQIWHQTVKINKKLTE